MNPEKYDFFRHVSKEPNNVALDLLRGLEDRSYSGRNCLTNGTSKEIFAEDELVRKKGYDEMRCEMPGQPRSTFLMVFSPDGSKVASTHGNHNIYVTDIKSGKNIKTLIGHPRTPWCIAFHPTSNQIVASGCLGGEVRIWDLSGGSEVWTAGNQSVIASIAFHPNDRVLVIATYNELYFWDWSRPEPFVQVATANPKEKIRYVAFDKLGHKLITGIANSPQTRWERVRAPVPVPRQAERSASPYRLRITPRLVNSLSQDHYFNPSHPTNDALQRNEPPRDSMSSVPERERRITASYRNLLREYEQLVQRYLKIYKPPRMIDRGTDPMEITPSGSTTSSSSTQVPENSEPIAGPSGLQSRGGETSQSYVSSLVMPSRILAMKRLPNSSTQTVDSRKHKSSESFVDGTQEKRSKCEEQQGATSSANGASSSTHTETGTQTQSPRKVLVIKEKEPGPGTSAQASSSNFDPQPSTSRGLEPSTSNADDLLSNIRPIAEEVRNRFLPIIKSLPAADRPKLIRRFENSRALERLKFRQVAPTFNKKPNRRPVQSSEGSSSEDDDDDDDDDEATSARNPTPNNNQAESSSTAATPSTSALPTPSSLATASTANISGVRNFVMELEQLLMTILMTEVEGNDNNSSNANNNDSPTNLSMHQDHHPADQSIDLTESPRSSPVPLSATRDQDIIRPNAILLGSTIFRRMIERNELLAQARANLMRDFHAASGTPPAANDEEQQPSPPTPPQQQPQPQQYSPVFLNTTSSSSARTNVLPIYTRTMPRRRLSSHRISAFMPTRVNYNRTTSMRYHRRGNLGGGGGVMSPGSASRLNSRFLPHQYLHHNNQQNYALDEPINYSNRPNAEDLPQEIQNSSGPSFDPLETGLDDTVNESTSGNVGLDSDSLGNMYSNIVQGLQSSLNDVRNIRASNRPGETSDMLSSFSESLENIMNQSDTILRNLGGSMSMLPTTATNANYNNGSNSLDEPSTSSNEPHLSFNDQNFYVASRNNNTPPPIATNINNNVSSALNLSMRSAATTPSNRSVVESDHNYPRNQNDSSMSPLMTSLHLTISYIQRQARLLRQQVESIERIDRAMFEVEQLQLIRQLIIEFSRYVRSLAGESRSTGMSSVRQMMAGTRISDSSPYDSQSEDHQAGPSESNAETSTVLQGNTAAATTPAVPPPSDAAAEPSTSATNSEQQQQQAQRPRTSSRKTYPPSRLHRLQRHNRRSLFVNLFPRRYAARPDRGSAANNVLAKHLGACRSSTRSNLSPSASIESSNPMRNISNYSLINSASLNLIASRLENLLTDQTRIITRSQEVHLQQQPNQPSTSRTTNAGTTASSSSNSTGCLEERMLSLRLHVCASRMDRILSTQRFRNVRTDSVVVTQDGTNRLGARNFLSLVIDRMSKHVEDSGGGANISPSIRGQIHNVLAMALLLSDLLLLQLVDSIPPPAGMNLDVERESLTSRIDQMCGQMLQNRFSGHSIHLTRSLQHMRLTMRHAYRALRQTYNTRRNAMMPTRLDTNRRQMLNIYLRNMNRRRTQQGGGSNTSSSEHENPGPSTSSGSNVTNSGVAAGTSNSSGGEMRQGLNDLIMRYWDNAGDEEEVGGTGGAASATGEGGGGGSSGSVGNVVNLTNQSSLNERISRLESILSNNSDDNDDENDWYVNVNNNLSRLMTPNLYRTNNVNLVSGQNDESSSSANGSSSSSSNNIVSAAVATAINSLQQNASAAALNNANSNSTNNNRPWNVPSVQVNDVPISEQPSLFQQRIMNHRQRLAERMSELRSSYPQMSVLRPRFLHPLYASVNPFDADLDDPQRETNYEFDMVTTVTPNHRIQMWDISNGHIPVINNPLKNIIVSECKIHNDASVDIAKDGTILVTLLPSGGYLNVTNKLGVYSLKWDTLGQCLYTTSFEQNAVSVALSPLSRHLVVGLASRRVSIVPSDRWTMARIFIIDQKNVPGDRLPVLRELGQSRDSRATNYKSVNCIRWLPTSGQGLIYATNTGQLVILT